MLLNMTRDYDSRHVWPGGHVARGHGDRRHDMESSLVQGFQLATASGNGAKIICFLFYVHMDVEDNKFLFVLI